MRGLFAIVAVSIQLVFNVQKYYTGVRRNDTVGKVPVAHTGMSAHEN